MQDSILEQVFAIPEMVELMVRPRHPELADELDFSTLDRLPADFVSNPLDGPGPNLLFLVDRRGKRKVLIHVRFLATVDPDVALHVHVYVRLAVQKLGEEHPELGLPGALAVVSLLLYYGKDQWDAPLDVEEVVPGLTKREVVDLRELDTHGGEMELLPALLRGVLADPRG